MDEKKPKPFQPRDSAGKFLPGKRAPNAGRRKGTMDKRYRIVREIFTQYDYDPIVSMIEIAMDKKRGIELRANMHKELASYGYAKLRAVEHSGEIKVEHTGVLLAPGVLSEDEWPYLTLEAGNIDASTGSMGTD